jgi:hypothetical protein
MPTGPPAGVSVGKEVVVSVGKLAVGVDGAGVGVSLGTGLAVKVAVQAGGRVG